MKKYLQFPFFLALFAFGLTAFAQSASAIPFVDLIPFGLNGAGVELDDNNSSTISPFSSWEHDITDNIGGLSINDITITDAELLVTYTGIDGSTTGEHWFLVNLGTLSTTGSTNFVFNGANLSDLQFDGKYTAIIQELSGGRDRFTLLSSRLSGNYTSNVSGPNDPSVPSAPEPMSAVLVMTGLGVMGLVRRFRKA